MKQRHAIPRAVILAVLMVLGLAASAGADRPQPFGQASLPAALVCDPPSPGIPPYVDTGFSLAFETKAKAVLITVTVLASFTTNSAVYIRPTIDGVGFNTDPQVAHL